MRLRIFCVDTQRVSAVEKIGVSPKEFAPLGRVIELVRYLTQVRGEEGFFAVTALVALCGTSRLSLPGSCPFRGLSLPGSVPSGVSNCGGAQTTTFAAERRTGVTPPGRSRYVWPAKLS